MLCCHITFPAVRGRNAITLRKPQSVVIDKSWKTLTDRAIIEIARNVTDFDKLKVNDVFRAGDPVEIGLGYDGEYYTEFSGYISRVSADIPIVIQCQDAMWLLKQRPAHISLPKATLQQLLFSIINDYEVDALEVDLGKVRYANSTVAKVLEDLKRTYGLFSYMRGQTVVSGKIYADDTSVAPVRLHLEKNVKANSLEYRNAEDISIRVKAVSTLPNGEKLTADVGDENGELRQLSYYNITSKTELKKLAEEDLKKFKIDGYQGTVTTFGLPPIEHGYKVQLESDIYPDRGGLYYVETVAVRFGKNYKYERIVTLGEKAQ